MRAEFILSTRRTLLEGEGGKRAGPRIYLVRYFTGEAFHLDLRTIEKPAVFAVKLETD